MLLKRMDQNCILCQLFITFQVKYMWTKLIPVGSKTKLSSFVADLMNPLFNKNSQRETKSYDPKLNLVEHSELFSP